MVRSFLDLTKFGIVIFVLLAGVAGYATSYAVETPLSWTHLAYAIIGLYALSSGSLALNQVQEWRTDQLMQRTQKRPIAAGKMTPSVGLIIAVIFLLGGSILLWLASPAAFWTGLASVVLYNGIYTYYWKRKMAFGAVPGAIPGSLPVTIGYAANDPNIFNRESLYLFLIMFLWQMPHFWVLAIKYKDDYKAGGIPVLPSVIGVDRTIYQIGLYTFVYVATALAAPWFVHASWIYALIVLPFAYFLIKEFFAYQKSHGDRWFKYFMWLNISMLVFLYVPVIDKWNFLFFDSN